MLYLIAVILLKLPIWLLLRPKIYGKRENLRIKGGVIFICNHRSLLDPVMVSIMTPRFVHYMAKSELFETKIGKWFFDALLVFPVSRKTADLKSIKKAISLLNEGKAFGIFPEGRRSITDRIDELEKGPAFIAAKSEAPVVPIYISPKTYSKSFRLRAMVGEVIDVNEIAKSCDRRKLNDVITNEMQHSFEMMRIKMEKIDRKSKMR